MICPSIYAEFIAGYRMDVSLARALASRGVAVQRFHYRGVGHSDGEAEETTFATMRDDALAAAERLLERTGVGGPAFLGTRFGGLVAASAAAEYPGCPLVLVDPTLEAETLLPRCVAGHADPGREGGDRSSHARRRARRRARARGDGRRPRLRICRPLFESVAGRTLVGELGDGARRVLLVQLGRALVASRRPRSRGGGAAGARLRRGRRARGGGRGRVVPARPRGQAEASPSR